MDQLEYVSRKLQEVIEEATKLKKTMFWGDLYSHNKLLALLAFSEEKPEEDSLVQMAGSLDATVCGESLGRLAKRERSKVYQQEKNAWSHHWRIRAMDLKKEGFPLWEIIHRYRSPESIGTEQGQIRPGRLDGGRDLFRLLRREDENIPAEKIAEAVQLTLSECDEV